MGGKLLSAVPTDHSSFSVFQIEDKVKLATNHLTSACTGFSVPHYF